MGLLSGGTVVTSAGEGEQGLARAGRLAVPRRGQRIGRRSQVSAPWLWSESSIGSDLRRVEALTGHSVLRHQDTENLLLNELASLLGARPSAQTALERRRAAQTLVWLVTTLARVFRHPSGRVLPGRGRCEVCGSRCAPARSSDRVSCAMGGRRSGCFLPVLTDPQERVALGRHRAVQDHPARETPRRRSRRSPGELAARRRREARPRILTMRHRDSAQAGRLVGRL